MLTQKEINEMRGLQTLKKKGCGDGLVIVRDPRSCKGSLYFYGVMGRRINGKRVQRQCWIGTEGKGVGQYTQKQAMEKWLRIKQWSLNHNRNPADYVKEENAKAEQQKTLRDAVNLFLKKKKVSTKSTTHREYCLKLENQVLTRIPPSTPLVDLEWSMGGRETVMRAIDAIGDGSKYDLANRCQRLLFQVFNCAISNGWMKKGTNPAEKLLGDSSPEPSVSHHPCLHWDQVPSLLKDVEMNRSSTNLQAVLSTKLLLMTFLRAGALVRLRWEWFDVDYPDTITIPGDTSGLKRKKGKNDHLPHHVPITTQMGTLFQFLRELNGGDGYVFQPMRESRFSHLDPSAPNNYLRSLGYKDVLRAHGWRSTALTTGIDVLGADREVIKKQMGHLPEGKVNRAYDKSLQLDKRRDFLQNWCNLLEANGLKV